MTRSWRAPRSAIALGVFGLCASGCATDQAAGGRRTFDSPQAAVDALVDAIRSNDQSRLLDVLGPEGEEIVSSGDTVIDRHNAETFLAAYDARNELRIEDDRATLLVGAAEWPLPIPLVRDGGSWWFDTEEGKEEILARRVGRNELAAILVCRAIVDAQHEYAASTPRPEGAEPEYAQKFLSDPGARNGLYWETNEGEPDSPLGPLVAEASARGYAAPEGASEGQPFHGYHYRMLTSQGPEAPGGARSYMDQGRMTKGFGVVAWPSAYGNSGIMTFIACHDGVVYQRDLGEETARIAEGMTAFDPGEGWEIVP